MIDLTGVHALFYIQSKPPTQKCLVSSSVGKGSKSQEWGVEQLPDTMC